MQTKKYPQWIYYPSSSARPKWVKDLVYMFSKKRNSINSVKIHRISNEVLSIIRDELESLGFLVEGGQNSKTISKPVNVDKFGIAGLQFQVDSYNKKEKLLLEVEASRSMLGNAIYKVIIQASLLNDVDFLSLAVPQNYRFKVRGEKKVEYTFKKCSSIVNAIYNSNTLRLPLRGFLLIGY